MDLDETRREFALRYYQWALEDARREIRDDFPLLRTIKGWTVRRLLARMDSLPEENRLRFGEALVKRFHAQALAIQGETLSAQERALIRDFLDNLITSLPGELEFNRDLRLGIVRLVKRRALVKLVRQAITPVLGDECEVWGPNVWRYTTSVNGWPLHTLSTWAGASRSATSTRFSASINWTGAG
jgi:hypothetical protein